MDQSNAPDPVSSAADDQPTQKFTPSVMQGLLAAGATQGARRPHDWSPPSVEDLQQALPQYEVTEFLARGGMGAVYKGVQRTLKRAVAIKILPPEIEDGDVQYAARFKHEAQAMARLSHPNIVAVHDAGETTGGLLYFVMEFIEGTDVAQLIASEGQLDAARTVQIITAVCDALAFAHEEGIIHRDIKPSNIMIDRKGRVKVADFGLAKTVNRESTLLTGSNVAMGTPDFIAPEALIAGTLVDQRADLYAVGVMLYQMLTGKIPRGRFDSPSQVVPKMGKGFDAIVDKAMQTDRDRRYSTATELKRAVEKVAPRPVPADGTGGKGSAKAAGSRHGLKPTTTLAAAIAVLALAGGAYVLTRPGIKPEQAVSASSSPSLPISKSSTSEPAAIKLWDAPEKLPPNSQTTTTSWDNGVVRMSGQIRDMHAVFRDGIVRAGVRMIPGAQAQLLFRHSVRAGAGTDQQKTSSYALYVSIPSATFQLARNNNGQVTKLQEWPFPRPYATTDWVKLEVKMVDDEITVSADGQVLGSVRDSTISNPGNVAINAKGDGYFRDIEYVPLDKPDSTVSSSPRLPVSPSYPSEPAAIKLWDAPEKIAALNKPNIRWENNAIHLVDKVGLSDGTIRQANMIVRADVLMNASATGPQISGRVLRNKVRVTDHYSLALKPGLTSVKLAVNHVSGQTELGAWPLSRVYRTDEWLPLELRIVGNEITAVAEGRILGSVKDDSIQGLGGLQLYVEEDGWFRKVEYVPLDNPATASAGNGAEMSTIKLWDAPDKLGNNPQVEWKDGAVHLLENSGLYAKPLSRDAILRASIRMNADAKAPQIHLRHVGEVHYKLAVNPTENYAVLARSDHNQETRLKQWPLPRRYRDDEWLRLELRAIGDQLNAVADGSELGTITDTSFKEPGSAAIFATNGWFKDIEYVVLDKDANPLQTQFSTSPEATKAEAAWKARWHKPGKLRAAGVDRMGKPLDLKAAEPYDDFVQVAVVDPNYYNGRAWAALRSQGDVVWSDGYLEKDKIGLKRSQAGVFSIGKGGKVTLPGVNAPEPVFDVSCTSLSVLPSKPGVIGWADHQGTWHVASTAYDSGLIERPDVTTGAKVNRIMVANQAVGVLREDGTLRIWSVKELSLPDIITRDVTDVLPMGEIWAVLKKDGSILKFPLKKSDKDTQLVMPTEGDISAGWKAKAMASGGFSLVFQRQDGRWTTDLPGLVEDTLAKLHSENNESFSVFREGAKGGIVWIEPVK